MINIKVKHLPHKNVHKVFSYFFILFMVSGLPNAFLTGTFLAGWKQVILVICFAMSYSLISQKNGLLWQIFIATLFVQITLIFTSMLSGLTATTTFYNLFYYTAWIPFFIWSASGGAAYYLAKYSNFTFYLVVACGVGLAIDSKTDLFLFLASRQAELDLDYFSQHLEVTKRSAFIFTTSTLVMPVLSAMIVVGLFCNQTIMRMAISTTVMVIGILTSGTTNSIIMSGGLLLGMLMKLGFKSFRIIGVSLAFVTLFFLTIPMLGGDEFIAKQIEPIKGHITLEDEGNVGRLWHWGMAIDDMESFSIIEHIVGSGLGTTNNNNGNQIVLHTHGESSFFQAYLEGGILGLMLRILPFILAVKLFSVNNLINRSYLTLGYLIAIFLVDAIAPLFGNIPSQALLGFLIGEMYRKNIKFSKFAPYKTA
jgi:hypothetical protein